MARHLLLGLVLSIVAVGACTPRGGVHSSRASPTSSSPEALIELGKAYAEQGQSVRAEQYFLAAQEQGADRDIVFALVLETCIASRRWGSARTHVDRRLKLDPSDPELLHLSASLNGALGQTDLAMRRAEALAEQTPLAVEHLLFLGAFFDSQGDRERAHHAFERYAARVRPVERPPWVAAALRRLDSPQRAREANRD